jgi:hypothetical protein
MGTLISEMDEDIEILLTSFELHLRATNKAPKTIKSYIGTLHLHLPEHERDLALAGERFT